MMRLSPVFGFLFLLVALSGCATSDRSSLKAETGGAIITERREMDIGKAVAQEVLREYSSYDDPKVNEYVNRVGQSVARVSERSNIPYRFIVLDHPVLNAFAAPGGYIFITRGLLSVVRNEAQLAAILGHEVAHVVERHSMKQMQAQAATIMAQIAGAVKGMGMRDISAAGDMATMIFLGYGREVEYHADALGVKYAYNAGYDPAQMVSFFDILRSDLESRGIDPQPTVTQEMVWDHPPASRRVENVRQAIENLKLWSAGPGVDGYRTDRKVGTTELEDVMAGNSFKTDEAAIDKVFTMMYTAYQAEDVDRLMSYVSRDFAWGKDSYFDFEKNIRFFFTGADQIQVATKKKEIRLKDSRTGYVNHIYDETYFDRSKNDITKRVVKERLWFTKKEDRWLLTGVDPNPKFGAGAP